MSALHQRIKGELIQLHTDFLKLALPSKAFNFTYIEKNASSLASHISRKKIPWSLCLTIAGLSYDHHRGQLSYGQSDEERKSTFKILMAHVIGLNNGDYKALSDSVMNTSEKVSLPGELLTSTSKICDESGCKLFQITKQSIYTAGSRLFGSWSEALLFCGIDYDKDVLKKIGSRPLLKIIEMFDVFDKDKNGSWSFQDIRNENSLLQKAIWNSFDKHEIVPFSEVSDNKVFIFYVILQYWRQTGKIDSNIDWWNENEDYLLTEYNENHRTQESWSIGKIQTDVLRRYANGENLSRPELNEDPKGKKLLAAMRSKAHGTKGQGEAAVLKRVGVLTPQLSELQNILDDIPLEFISAQLRRLVGESLENGENRLTREYVQQNHFELMSAASRWYRRLSKSRQTGVDWSATLKFFGLSPDVFSIAASERSNRGFVFQRFFQEILNKYMTQKQSVNDVLYQGEFCSDVMIDKSQCNHFIRCRPDFFLHNTIIDTKVGGTLAKPEQLERYLDHAKKVFIITINDKPKVKKLGNGEVEIMGLPSFLERSYEIVGVKIPATEIDGLTQLLKDAVSLSILK